MLVRRYIWEKLMLTVNVLVTGEGQVKHRLASAYISHLKKLRESPPSSTLLELPESLAEELRGVLHRLHEAYQSVGDFVGDFEFDAAEASQIAGKILSIHNSVCRMEKP